MSEHVLREVERFGVDVPIDEAWTPPASWYTEPAFLGRETERVFRRTWQYACPAAHVERPGSYTRFDLLGESYVVLRDEGGTLRAFHNVCRHHASELVHGRGSCDTIVCPYHGWSYGLDGGLQSAPHMGAMKGFDRGHFGLQPLAVEAWGPLIFVHAGSPSRSVAEWLGGLERRLADFDATPLVWVTQRRYPMACNWKVFVDNYLDGGYHIAHLHHGLASQLELDAYRTELEDGYNVQTCPSDPAPTDIHGHDFSERIGQGAVYAWLYPNFMLNRYGPILDTNYVLPIDHERCEVVFDYWYPEAEVTGESPEARSFIEQSLEASDRVQQEDVWISESVQRGLRSTAYDRGRYAPQLEIGMYQFHRMLAADLA